MNEGLHERLRRLRREVKPAPEAPRSAELPAWFRERMARRVASPRAESAPTSATLLSSSTHVRTLGMPRELFERSNEFGSYAVREVVVPLEHFHGHTALASIDAASHTRLAEHARDKTLTALDPRTCVFLDIETTGLSGGAGTKSFLVALGTLRGASFELWQGFLREPSEERALLHECAERIHASRGVISFFGKSFDRHRLEDKMRVHRIAPPFTARPHLDLYWPCRRAYRAQLPNCKLATLERALCGVERPHDLPGSFAPEAWFDFLAQRPHLLEQVFQHNRDDVLSLVALCAHLGAN